MKLTLVAEGQVVDPIVHYDKNVEAITKLDEELRWVYKYSSFAANDYDKFDEKFAFTKKELKRLETYMAYPPATFEIELDGVASSTELAILQAGHVKVAAKDMYTIVSTYHTDHANNARGLITNFLDTADYPEISCVDWMPTVHDSAYILRAVVRAIMEKYCILDLFE